MTEIMNSNIIISRSSFSTCLLQNFLTICTAHADVKFLETFLASSGKKKNNVGNIMLFVKFLYPCFNTTKNKK